MTKLQFLFALRDRLTDLPQSDLEERLHFYSEMIEDRMEEGLSEEEAVMAVGSVDEIAGQIASEIPSPKKVSAKRHWKTWEIVLLALGSPIWFSLLITVFAIVLSLYVSLWAIFVSIAACALAGIVTGIALAFSSYRLPGIGLIGAGIICAGISIILFFSCKWATKGLARFVKNIFKRRGA